MRTRKTRHDTGYEVNTQRLARLIPAIEHIASNMQHALSKYLSNPRKYKPQLDNIKSDAYEINSILRTLVRTIDKSEE